MKRLGFLTFLILLSGGAISPASALEYEEYPSIRLRSLDKITARTLTFDAQVGNTIKFGDIYIKILSCRKPPPVEKTEAAAFLQIWQIDKEKEASRWVFSGWMFSSSPALSGMDHPVYDVWVIDCLGKDPEAMPKEDSKQDLALPDEGPVPEGSVAPQPSVTPEQQKSETPPASPVIPAAPSAEDTVEEDVPTTAVPAEEAAPQQQEEQPPQKDSFDGIY